MAFLQNNFRCFLCWELEEPKGPQGSDFDVAAAGDGGRYRGTSIIRNRPTLGPFSRPTPGGGASLSDLDVVAAEESEFGPVGCQESEFGEAAVEVDHRLLKPRAVPLVNSEHRLLKPRAVPLGTVLD
jgi:hypothetical protein